MTTHRLMITTSLPTTRSISNRLRRQPIMCTTIHASDIETKLTFLADSTHHQLSIMTLTTHIFLSIPIIHQKQRSWNTIRYTDIHQQTLYPIIATTTLKRYHKL